MDWANLNFKGKDVIMFIIYAVTLAFGVAGVRSSLERQGEKIEEMQSQIIELKSDGKGTVKENQVFLQNLQNQISINATQIQLLKQDVQMLKEGYFKNNN